MPTLNSDVTVNSYNNIYLFSMKYLYRNDSIWKFVAIFCHTTSLIPSFSSNILNYVYLKICIIPPHRDGRPEKRPRIGSTSERPTH